MENILYTGTRMDITEDNPIGRCAVYDSNGQEINPVKVGEFDAGISFSGLFDWGQKIVGTSISRIEKTMRANLLSKTILELECKERFTIDACIVFRRAILDSLPTGYWEISEEKLEEALLAVFKYLEGSPE